MPLQNALPLPAVPGFTWSSVTPQATQEIITVYNTEELSALTMVPEPDIAWANVGTNVSLGSGIVKIPWRLPQSMAFTQFNYGGTRSYFPLDVAAPAVKVDPWQLNFAWPMIWDAIGNGWKLMNQGLDGTLFEFTGASGLANEVVNAGRAYKAQMVATAFWKGLTDASLGLTAELLTIPQPGLPNGNALFTNGVDSPLQYAHPFNSNSGRFQNAWPAFGAFATNFGASLVKMTQKPHPTLPNMTFGAQVTDVFGPTYMRERFWNMAVQTLTLQTATQGGNGVAAATTNPFMLDALRKFAPDSFIGASGFAPQRYWIVPQLDNHPYYTANNNANMTTGPGGGPADMWINLCAQPGRGAWLQMAGNSRECVPFARMYGEGDPRAMSERRVRLETDLDLGMAAGVYHLIDMFFGV